MSISGIGVIQVRINAVFQVVGYLKAHVAPQYMPSSADLPLVVFICIHANKVYADVFIINEKNNEKHFHVYSHYEHLSIYLMRLT